MLLLDNSKRYEYISSLRAGIFGSETGPFPTRSPAPCRAQTGQLVRSAALLLIANSRIPTLSEARLGGYRLQAHKESDNIRLYSRRGNDFTKKFARIATAVSKVKAASFILTVAYHVI